MEEVDFLFNHLETIIRKLENIGFGREGELRIGFLGSAAQNVMPELILKLNQSHPAIQTLLEEMSNRMQVEFILKDKLDLGFVQIRRVPNGIARYSVMEDTFSIVLPIHHNINSENFENLSQFV